MTRQAVAEYVDAAAILDGTHKAPETSVGGRRSDGAPLLYAAAVNVLVGPPEAGKSLVAAAMAADELFSGGRVLWVDLDHNGPASILARFRGFGVPRDVLVDQSRFRLAVPHDANDMLAIVPDTTTWNPTIAVVDSIGELLPMFGANSNDADDFTRVNRQILAAMAGHGAGVLGIDHEAKGEASRSYGATGTAAKKRAVDGVMMRVTNVRPFRPGAGGEAVLSIVKDRHGSLRQLVEAEREPNLAGFVIDAVGGYRFPMPTVKPSSSSDLEELLELVPPPSSVKDVRGRKGWGTTRASSALRQFRAVTSNAEERPVTLGDSGVTPFPSPIGEERVTLTGNGFGNPS